jgi:hypothetical protein
MAYTTIDDPSAYFQTALYTGNATARSITNTGNSDLQPDWIWIKSRSTAHQPVLTDSVRGTGKELRSDTSDAESSLGNITAFNSDGFSIGTRGEVNNSGSNFVAWNWKAGTSFTNDASATGIGSIDSTGSVNDTAGFSIVSYVGTGSAGTIKHGLSSAPTVIFAKDRQSTQNWQVYHSGLGATNRYLELNSAAAYADGYAHFAGTAPTSSVFSIGAVAAINANGNNTLCYCFAEKKGYSKFGSYTGNGSTDGTFIYTGFSPAWVLVKRSDAAESWFLYDNKRNAHVGNERYYVLRPNTEAAENTTYSDNWQMDFLSNGFKLRTTAGHLNGGAAIYMAFAEAPFVTSTGVPATAR